MPNTYQTRQLRVSAVQFNGKNITDLQDLVFDKGVILTNPDGTLNLYLPNGEVKQIRPLWWISVGEDDHVSVHSHDAFTRIWAPSSTPVQVWSGVPPTTH